MHAPTAVVPSLQIAQACIPLMRTARQAGAHLLARRRASCRRRAQACEAAGVPTYATPERAVTAFVRRVQYQRNQEALLQTPQSSVLPFAPDRARARSVIDGALAEGRDLLDEVEAKALLDAYGIPIVPTRVARSIDEAAAMAGDIGYPVVLKILSPQVSHKSDVGGVALDLADDAARAARRAGDGRTAADAASRCAARRLHRAGDGAPAARARADRRRRRTMRCSARC